MCAALPEQPLNDAPDLLLVADNATTSLGPTAYVDYAEAQAAYRAAEQLLSLCRLAAPASDLSAANQLVGELRTAYLLARARREVSRAARAQQQRDEALARLSYPTHPA